VRPATPEELAVAQKCVTAQPKPNEFKGWHEEVRNRLKQGFHEAEHCFDGMSGPAQIVFNVGRGRGATDVWIEGFTSDKCDVAQCVAVALKRIDVPPLPDGVDEAGYAATSDRLMFDPDQAPHLALESANSGDRPEAVSCAEKPPHQVASGRLAPELIQDRVRASYPEIRTCYDEGLSRKGGLTGRVSTRFVIQLDGSVTNVDTIENTLPDCEVTACINKVFGQLKFDKPSGGKVTVVYPLAFAPF
jgi:hypothetical protein